MSKPTVLFNCIASNLFQTNPATHEKSLSQKPPDKTQNIARNINQSNITQASSEPWYKKTQVIFAARALSITSALAVVYVAYRYFTNGNIPANTNFPEVPPDSSSSNTFGSSEDSIDPLTSSSEAQVNSEKEVTDFLEFTPHSTLSNISAFPESNLDCPVILGNQTWSETHKKNTGFIKSIPPISTLTLAASPESVDLLPLLDNQAVPSQTNQIPNEVAIDVKEQDIIGNSIASPPPSSAKQEEEGRNLQSRDKISEPAAPKKKPQLDGTSTGFNTPKTEATSIPEPTDEPRIEFGPQPKPLKKSKKADKKSQAVDEAQKKSKKNKKGQEEQRVEYGPQNKPLNTKKK